MQFFGLICAGFDGKINYSIKHEIIWIIIIGICGLIAHYCLTKALSLAPAIIVSPLEFLRLPFISIVGYILYSENLELYVFLKFNHSTFI